MSSTGRRVLDLSSLAGLSLSLCSPAQNEGSIILRVNDAGCKPFPKGARHSLNTLRIQVMDKHMQALAAQHLETKFVKVSNPKLCVAVPAINTR